MSLLDTQLKKNPYQYLKQCLLAMVSVFILFFLLNIEQHSAIISTLGATIFVVFSLPHSYASQPRRILGGYFWGTVIGIGGHFLIITAGTHSLSLIMIGAGAAGITLFLMAATNAEHPPAAGLAIGLLYHTWSWEILLVIWGAIIYLSALRFFLGNWLIDLTYGANQQKKAERS